MQLLSAATVSRNLLVRAALAMVLVLVVGAGSAHAAIFIDNDSFEAPDAAGLGGHIYLNLANGPQGGWFFSDGGNGLAENGSAFSVSNAPGTQAAFLQNDGNFIYQDLTVTAGDVGLYTISVAIEGRPTGGGGFQDNPVKILFGPSSGALTDLGNYSPTSATNFNTVTTGQFLVPNAGTYRLQFEGTSTGGDITSFIDTPSLNFVSVPEPGSMTTAGLGLLSLLGLMGLRRRRR